MCETWINEDSCLRTSGSLGSVLDVVLLADLASDEDVLVPKSECAATKRNKFKGPSLEKEKVSM